MVMAVACYGRHFFQTHQLLQRHVPQAHVNEFSRQTAPAVYEQSEKHVTVKVLDTLRIRKYRHQIHT